MCLPLKNLLSRLVIITVLLSAADSASSQTATINEPRTDLPLAFNNAGDTILVSHATLQNMFSKNRGEEVSINNAAGLFVKGLVNAKAQRRSDLVSVVIKLDMPANTTLFLSQIERSPGNFLYRGRITGKGYGDCYELKEKDSATYILVKKSIYDLQAE